MVAQLADPELPVRVDSVVSVRHIVDASEDVESLKPVLPLLLSHIFQLMGEVGAAGGGRLKCAQQGRGLVVVAAAAQLHLTARGAGCMRHERWTARPMSNPPLLQSHSPPPAAPLPQPTRCPLPHCFPTCT